MEDGLGLPSLLSWFASTNRRVLFDRVEAMLRRVVPSVTGVSVVPVSISENERVPVSVAGTVSEVPILRSVAGLRIKVSFGTGASAAEVTASAVSEGTLFSLAIISALHQPETAKLILIDDLDRGLHPKAQGELIACLREMLAQMPDTQIICSSHSPYLIDHFQEPEVRVLAREGAVVVKRLRDHPDWSRIGTHMRSGEFWSTVGEDWKG